jgi:hypothetical protein
MLRRHSQNINKFKISTFRVFSKSQDDRHLVENGMSTLILAAIKKDIAMPHQVHINFYFRGEGV